MVILCCRAVKKNTYLSINCSSPFSSGDISKSKRDENPLWAETIAVTQVKKIHADLDWQLYIWGRCDLVLMLRLPTWLMWPRSVLTGHWAAGHRGQSWKVGKRLRLHSCDWLTPSGQPPMISHVPAAPQSSDPTMKEREHDGDDQESVKEQWGRTTMNLKDADRGRHEQQENKKGKNKSDWCVEIVKGKLWAQERERARKSCFYLFEDLSSLFLAWRKVTSSG